MSESQPSTTDQLGPMPAAFIVGQDQRGQWVALETRGLAGGIFKTLQDAIRFADFETNHRPGAVTVSRGTLRLML